MWVLVTGAAGFIGSHVAERLIGQGHDVVGLDNLTPFYDPQLKRRNLSEIQATAARSGRRFELHEADLRDQDAVRRAVGERPVEAVVHLAAAAGVRPSIEQPLLYEEVNVRGTMHVLEAMREAGVRRLVFASSSSVYGNNPKVPFAETDPVDHPISPYAATKKAGEVIAHCYHHLYGLSVACLRFFTVYGPRQRPDLAISKFTRLIEAGQPLPLYGDGSSSRDYTYVDDTVDGVLAALAWTDGEAPRYEVFNLGNSSPVPLRELVELLEAAVGRPALVQHHPAQPGDVERTWADVERAAQELGYRPRVDLRQGLERYVAWARGRQIAGARTA